MKRLSLAIIFACCTLASAAQEGIRVNYQGTKPSISDFVWAYLSSFTDDEDDCIDESTNAFKQAWIKHRNGEPQEEGETLTVDEKNGYVLYEIKQGEHLSKWEMCYWNEADQQHKLFAYNVWSYTNGKPSLGQFDTLIFYRYNNATKKMTMCETPGFEVEYYNTSYSLPHTGKDIIVTKWNDNGTKKQQTLKWNGNKFSF